MKPNQMISEAEWEVMRVVWTKGTVGAKEIMHALQADKQWQPSTVKTLLRRLVQKEALAVETVGNKFLYTAQITQNEVVTQNIAQLLIHVCTKEHAVVLQQIIEQVELTPDNVAQIQTQLTQKKTVETVVCRCLPDQCLCGNKS